MKIILKLIIVTTTQHQAVEIKFAEGHPLYETHVQRLRSKIKVPVPCRVPRPPPIKPRILTESWKKQAREFSRFFLVLFRPWQFKIGGTKFFPLGLNQVNI